MPRQFLARLAFILWCVCVAQPALSCMVTVNPTIDDVKFSDLVVVGRIANYHIVLDAKAREERKAMIANLPEYTSDEWRAMLSSQASFIGDYARFDILVDEVLHGSAADKITAVWDNSTFGEPGVLDDAPFLIALLAPGSDQPPLSGPSATISPRPDSTSMQVLQAPCSDAFVFPESSPEVSKIRAILALK